MDGNFVWPNFHYTSRYCQVQIMLPKTDWPECDFDKENVLVLKELPQSCSGFFYIFGTKAIYVDVEKSIFVNGSFEDFDAAVLNSGQCSAKAHVL